MTRLHIDVETHSQIDLRKVGSSRYAQDPSTDVTCVCWAVDDGPVRRWIPSTNPKPPVELMSVALSVLSEDTVEVHAWNAKFEHDIWVYILAPRYGIALPAPNQWHCTMAQASYWGLPAKLEVAGPALGIPFNLQKYATAHRLMLQMSRPRGWARKLGYAGVIAVPVWWHKTDPDKLQRLVEYCEQDVEAERAIHDATSALPGFERNIWLLDQRMNHRGIAVDIEFAETMRSLAAAATFDLNREMRTLTQGQVTSITQVNKLLPFVQSHGMPGLKDLRKETIESLADPEGDVAEQALALRRDGAKTSVAKLDAMLAAVEPDNRLRGSLRYYGTRTGRWSGAGGARVQLHNLPRGTLKNPLEACQDIIDGQSPDYLRKFHGRLLDVVSSCLRGCFVASPGKTLVAGDFSQIEARMLAWLAGQDDVLKIFADGHDIYTYDANKLGSTNRQLGKTFRLGAGYGTGVAKIIAIARGYGVALSVTQAQNNIWKWRSDNPKILELWADLDRGVRRMVMARPGTQRMISSRIGAARTTGGVALILPSARWLIYRNARIEVDPDDGRDSLVYDGINPYTNQWGAIRTWGSKLAADVTQGSARDIMATALFYLANVGLDPLLSVHDEIIAEIDEADGAEGLKVMLNVMKEVPLWATGLPVEAAGWYGPRYHKA